MTDEAGEETIEQDEESDPIEDLGARVAELEKELQYSAAEMVNVRQRAARERSEALRYGGSCFVGCVVDSVSSITCSISKLMYQHLSGS